MIGGLEDCDGSALTLTSCSDVGYYLGTLSCLPSCRYEVSGCTGQCGDGIRNGSPSELCDKTDLGAMTCDDFGVGAQVQCVVYLRHRGMISCGANVAGTNNGGNRIIDGYGCSTSRATLGTEVAYRFVATATQSVTVEVNKNAFLDLAVIADDISGACEPHGGCVGASHSNSSSDPDIVTFNAVAGQVYYFIVDGSTAAVNAPFTIEVICN